MPPRKLPRETLLSVAEAAAYLGVHRDTIRRWIRNGTLPSSRVGGKLVRVRLGDLDSLVHPVGASEEVG